MIQVNCGSLSTSCDKRVFTFEKCRGVKVSTVSVTSISYFTHTDRPFIPTITRGVLGLHSLISSIRAGSISQRSAIDAGLAKTAQPEIFSHNFLNNDLFYRFPFRCCVNGREWMKLWIACQLFTSAPIVVFIIIHIW